MFNRLSLRRGSNGFSVNPITHVDMDAFVRVTGMVLAPWEVEVIEELDNIYRTVLANKTSEEER